MYQIDFNKPQHIYFMGIGGISMSGLAEILMDEGFTVTGSDSKESELTEHLRSRGAVIYIGQRAENIRQAEQTGRLTPWCTRQLFIPTIRSLRLRGRRGFPCFPEPSFWGR